MCRQRILAANAGLGVDVADVVGEIGQRPGPPESPGCFPGLRPVISRDDRAFAGFFLNGESVDSGLDEFQESDPSWRSSSAILAASLAINSACDVTSSASPRPQNLPCDVGCEYRPFHVIDLDSVGPATTADPASLGCAERVNQGDPSISRSSSWSGRPMHDGSLGPLVRLGHSHQAD